MHMPDADAALQIAGQALRNLMRQPVLPPIGMDKPP